MSTLPSALLAEIFHRLPIKTLAICKCVCKPWNGVIASPTFLSTHLANTLKASSSSSVLLLLRRCSGAEQQYTLHLPTPDPPLPLLRSVTPPPLIPLPRNRFFRIADSCAGAILLADDLLHATNTYALWNPTTRRVLRLPDPHFRRRTHTMDDSWVGLAYDATAADFKVLRVALLPEERTEHAEVYSVKAGAWRTVVDQPPLHCREKYCRLMAFCNGHLNYAGWEGSTGETVHNVMTFNLSKEKFGIIPFPERIRVGYSDNTVYTYNGPAAASQTIAIFHIISVPLLQLHRPWELWVLTDYNGKPESWVCLARAEVSLMMYPWPAFFGQLLLCGSSNGRVIAVELLERQATREVDLGPQEVCYLFDELDGKISINIPTSAASYVETLALADVDLARLQVYGADHRPAAPPLPPTAGSYDDLKGRDTEEIWNMLGGLYDRIGRTLL